MVTPTRVATAALLMAFLAALIGAGSFWIGLTFIAFILGVFFSCLETTI